MLQFAGKLQASGVKRDNDNGGREGFQVGGDSDESGHESDNNSEDQPDNKPFKTNGGDRGGLITGTTEEEVLLFRLNFLSSRSRVQQRVNLNRGME